MNTCSSINANVIDDVSGEANITAYWKDHFYKILNSNVPNMELKHTIMGKLDAIQYDTDMIVSTIEVSQIISKLQCGKAAGPDCISAEYLKFAHQKLCIMLSLCFSSCLSHGYLPPAMIETTIVPIVKNKCGNLSDSNNYTNCYHNFKSV